ncbi:hypothetical protein KC327_g5699 [Hortaea werneckii]|nr:hypothetical protein KC348_g5894 [Hortaea werneckii]KAI6937497.1 hypothetical protein KC341_g5532 [Hortaea werneckii]KAI6973065.1 hypothetical protein KC321_g5883 [Hortaea werneckii]KAI7073775.1 hypothetical protein KC327_g5699 [Hortaea werneckii]KAI7433452.1 hypothetical protein KC336_g4043 [Hortaea werneckii]
MQQQLHKETATVSQERHILDQTRDDLRDKTEENTTLKLEISRHIESQQNQANSLGSQLTDVKRDLASVQQKYDPLRKESINHWQDMDVKTRAVQATKAELREAQRVFAEGEVEFQTTVAAMEAEFRELTTAKEDVEAELQQATNRRSRLAFDNKKLSKKASQADIESASTKPALEAHASQAKADMTQMGETLREAHYTCSLAQYRYTLLESERGRAHDSQNTLTEVMATLWPGADTSKNDSPTAVAEMIKTQIASQAQLNAVAATAIRKTKNETEPIVSSEIDFPKH